MPRRAANNSLDGRLTDGQLDLVVRQIDSLPIAPPVGRALLRQILDEGSEGASPAHDDDLTATARLDPFTASWLLRQGNADAGAINQDLRSLVLSANLGQLLDGAAKLPLDPSEFWRHSLAVGVATREIAGHLALPIDPDEAFACGLLHDLGKLALAAALPKSYARVLSADRAHTGNIADAEQELLGVDHTIVGRRLAQHWRLPPTVESVLWLHHQDPQALPESVGDRQLVAAVGLADAVARHVGIGFSGNFMHGRPLESWARLIGCRDWYVGLLVGNLGELVQATLDELGAGDSAARAPSGREIARCLTRHGEALVGRHESPAPKARAFDILADFLAGVSADTTSAQTLAHAASAVAQAIGVEPTPAGPIVAYCLDAADSDGTALWCRCDGANRFEWRTAPRAAETPESAPASPQAVVELLSGSGDLKDWLDASDCEHQGLLFAGRWIGGVFVPSQRATPTPQQWAQSPYSTLLGAMGLALGIVQGQERARRLNEGLSHASRVLSEASQALSEAQTAGLIGQMAAGAAHELNNPLAVISGRAQLMRSRAKTPDEKKVWTTIVEQAQRISDILTELMSIASPPPPEPQVVAPRALLDHACKAFDEMRPSTAPAPKIEIAVGDAAPAAFVDPSQMEWAIGELIANAFTAGGDGVRVRLSAEDSGDEELLVTIEDDGPGMDDSTLERAFTPFFSSQPAGRRRGLGLTRVRRWVEINRGSVHVTSRPGAGTQVRLRLPTE